MDRTGRGSSECLQPGINTVGHSVLVSKVPGICVCIVIIDGIPGNNGMEKHQIPHYCCVDPTASSEPVTCGNTNTVGIVVGRVMGDGRGMITCLVCVLFLLLLLHNQPHTYD